MIMSGEKKLSDVLKRGANNFDILRLLAAIGVIVGHAYAIAPQPPHQDGIGKLLHFDYSGSLAVKFFFFLSGMLVTNSILSNSATFQFLVKRAFRIFPALLVCLLVAVFIIGPIFTKLPLSEYFSSPDTWNYIKKNFLLTDLQWKLTGVFSDSKYGLNGCLWTLPYEVLCYLYLAIIGGLALLKNKWVANILFITIIGVAILAPQNLPAFFSQNPDSYLLPACFAFGALFAKNKEMISINFSTFVLLWLLIIISNTHTPVYQFIFYITFFYSTVYIASLSFIIKYLKLPFDASYGVYVYGFMIQQCVHALFPNMGVHGNQNTAIPIAVGMGILSWYFIEKPSIKWGHQLAHSQKHETLKNKMVDLLKKKGIINNKSSGATKHTT